MARLGFPSPGRPETLTKEEEAKLKEFWTVVLKVFGVANANEAAVTGAIGRDEKTVQQVADDLSATAISGDPKKKKEENRKSKIGSLLYRSKKEKEQQPTSTLVPAGLASNPAAVVVKIDEKDDKHGQTKDFQAALATQTPAELREAFWSMVKSDNPDALLLRFLRARKWDVEKALVMMVATMQWRANEMKVHEVVYKGESGPVAAGDNDFMTQLRMGKSFLHGWDKAGRPICHVRVKLHKAGEQSEESLERYTVYIMETARLMLSSQVDTAAVLFDMTGFSMANMDYAPVRFLIKCFEAHYPESLGVCLVHKAPWIFQGIWSIIKGWLDPVVASKIHFTKTNEDLEQFIPKEHIIKELGGLEDWEYVFQEPVAGEDAALGDKVPLAKLQAERAETVKRYEDLTRAWINVLPGPSAGETENSLEVLSNSKIKAERLDVAKSLRGGYWKLDKYVRGRTFYDRTGVIGPDGMIDFYSSKGATVGKTVAAATS
ncbi:CRAL/TRIO domain-containing protein [Terfezia boudieri ATCC MYA-4762]|uniref:CRAL/TRIO domain-containing protein n=1 Tax=Terfezia boudieri ATCC MYA-4762 TaxID=1051890 RepID=A0A3N4M2P6_9PEZI|nr:CRAL/TRIO domain-containing protein [Terfezia boudieri ATCC MYA-4762]